MPGFDHHGKRTAKLMREALKQAGLPEPLEMEVSAAPYQRHGHRAGSYAVPKYLADYPQYHVRVRWAKPQLGPIVVGAGRFRGLGLLCPLIVARTSSTGENSGKFAPTPNPMITDGF